ncbi:hypothetical protein V8B97DRAFT_2009474 [Scleroderma yunnanense]
MANSSTTPTKYFNSWPNDTGVKKAKGATYSVDHRFDGFSQNYRLQIVQTGSSATNLREVLISSERIHTTGNMASFNFGQKRDPYMSFFEKVTSVPILSAQSRPEDNISVIVSINPPGLNDPQAAECQNHGGHILSIHTLITSTDAVDLR